MENSHERQGRRQDGRRRRGPQAVLLTIPEAAEALAIGRTTLYGLIDDRRIEVVHIGRCVRVPVDALRTFVDDQRERG